MSDGLSPMSRDGSGPPAPNAPRRLRVIGVTSGKGGVGKTTLSVNLAILAAMSGQRVLLLDGDLGLANVEILLGISPRYSIADLLDGSATIQQVLAQGPHGIQLLPAGSGLHRLARLDEGQKQQLLHAFDELEDEFDLVLLDSPAGIGENVHFLMGGCQEAILVVTQEPTSLTDAYVALKTLSEQAGIRTFHVVVNQVGGGASAAEVFERLCRLSNRFLDASLHLLGSIPRDEHVQRAIMSQRPLATLHPLAPATRAISQISTALWDLPSPSNLDGGLKFLWQRLFLELHGGKSR